MVALLETADSFKELGVHADRVEAYIALCKDVAQFWTDHRSKVHEPSGLYGFCYSEFCETTEIGGVRHNEDYFAFNSNSMMGAALLRLHELADGLCRIAGRAPRRQRGVSGRCGVSGQCAE